MQLRKLLVCLLLFASALTIALIPEASSQQFTTSTALQTSTWTQTSTNYFTNTYNVVSYSSSNSTSVGTLTITTQITNTQTYGAPCYWFVLPFWSVGSTVHIHFSGSESWMSLYILDGSDLTSLSSIFSNGVCYPFTYRFVNRSPSSSGDFDVSLASDNPYFLFVETSGLGNPPTFYLTIGPVSIVSSITTTALIESASLAEGTSISTGTTTLTSLTSLEVPFMQTYGSWIVTAIIAAVALGMVVLYSRRKEQPKATKGRKRNSKRKH